MSRKVILRQTFISGVFICRDIIVYFTFGKQISEKLLAITYGDFSTLPEDIDRNVYMDVRYLFEENKFRE